MTVPEIAEISRAESENRRLVFCEGIDQEIETSDKMCGEQAFSITYAIIMLLCYGLFL